MGGCEGVSRNLRVGETGVTWNATMRKRGDEELWEAMMAPASSAYISGENTPGEFFFMKMSSLGVI